MGRGAPYSKIAHSGKQKFWNQIWFEIWFEDKRYKEKVQLTKKKNKDDYWICAL